ncbi:hypothetical protein M434DRAFT_26823 [Hypoxylon sp. CO27-5]|nr:hypothetical protein M434DRAFT_26823 [Hypoxylon sp. CO27-5]
MHNVENRKCQNPIISSSSMRREPAISHSFGYSGMGPPFRISRTAPLAPTWIGGALAGIQDPLIPEWGSGGRDRVWGNVKSGCSRRVSREHTYVKPGAASCRSDGSYWMSVLLLEAQQISAAVTATSLMGNEKKKEIKDAFPLLRYLITSFDWGSMWLVLPSFAYLVRAGSGNSFSRLLIFLE